MSHSLRSFGLTILLVGCMVAGHLIMTSGQAFAQSSRRAAGSGSKAARNVATPQRSGSGKRSAAAGSSYRGGGSDTKNAAVQTTGFALVELFTSEGYRSAKRAQQQVEWVERTGRTRDLPVYTIAFHVDHLNTEDFKDPYSTSGASVRQQAYATAYSKGSMAAPLMIINGEAKLPGSRNTAKEYINAALGSNPVTDSRGMEVKAEYTENAVKVNCELTGLQADDRLNIALVQDETSREVMGDNGDKQTITHLNVVRDFKVVDGPDAEGMIGATLTLPEGSEASQFHVVVYAQSSANRNIRLATVATLQAAKEETEEVTSAAMMKKDVSGS